MMFFTKNIDTLELSKEESKHCFSVLRKKVGDLIELFDGNGSYAKAELTQVGKLCTFKILERHLLEHNNSNNAIAIAPPKKSTRFDFLVEKLTELGVQNIYFLETKNSERNRINKERVEKQLIAACKQAKILHLPKVEYQSNIKSLLSEYKSSFVCHCNEKYPRIHLNKMEKEIKKTIFFIGPEGDFNNQEIEEFMDAGAIQLSLGDTRLRTETAAIYIASWLKSIS